MYVGLISLSTAVVTVSWSSVEGTITYSESTLTHPEIRSRKAWNQVNYSLMLGIPVQFVSAFLIKSKLTSSLERSWYRECKKSWYWGGLDVVQVLSLKSVISGLEKCLFPEKQILSVPNLGLIPLLLFMCNKYSSFSPPFLTGTISNHIFLMFLLLKASKQLFQMTYNLYYSVTV